MATDISPRFTVSLRGYDKEEVERYLATVSERTSQTDDQLYELQEQNRYLEEEHERLAARVSELEVAIRSETPHTVGALGERITLILNEAEEGAAETLTKATAEAEYLLAQAQKEAEALRRQASAHAAEAVEHLAAARRDGEQLGQRLELEAKARASSILNDAEHRAQRRQDQIEKWAQEMIAHTQAEQARLADEFAMIRRGHEAEVRALTGDRDDAVVALRALQTSLGQAIERITSGRAAGGTAATGTAATGTASAPSAPASRATTETSGTDSEPATPPEPEVDLSAAPSDAAPAARYLSDTDGEGSTRPTAILGRTDSGPSANGNDLD